MIQDKTIVANFVTLTAFIGDVLRMHLDLAELVERKMDGLSQSEKRQLKDGVEKSRQALSKLKGFLAGLQP